MEIHFGKRGVFVFLSFSCLASAQMLSLGLSSGTTTTGGAVTLNLSLNSSLGNKPASLQWTLNVPPQIVSTSTVVGPAGVAAGKSLYCDHQTCLLAGLNKNVISDGVVAVITMTLSPSATGNFAAQLSTTVAAALDGSGLAIGSTSGVISVIPGGSVSLSIDPVSATLMASQSQQFTASVTGTANTAVSWSVSPALGTVSASGVYTAPSTVTAATVVTVTAKSVVDLSKTASAVVYLQPNPNVAPPSATLTAGHSQQFTAQGATLWSISPNLGSVSSTGLFTAPASLATSQTVTVTATFPNGGTSTATALVVPPPSAVTVAITPSTAYLLASQTQTFTASLTGAPAAAVSWSVSPALGTVSASGVYTAPSAVTLATIVTVTAKSIVDLSKAASAIIYLQPNPAVAPPSATLTGGNSQQFTAQGATLWSISPNWGRISSTGLFTAPASPATSQTVTVTATFPNGGTSTATAVLSPASPSIMLSSPALSYSFQTGGAAPSTQGIAVSSSGSQFSFTVAKTGDWLSVSPLAATTPAALTIAVNPVGLAAGTYSGQVTVTAPSTVNSSQSISVTLTIGSAPLLAVSPSSLQLAFQTGAANPPPQNVTVSSTGASLNFTAKASMEANWLTVAPSAGATPAALSVGVNPAGLAPGTYTGSVAIAAGGVSQRVAVTLTISSAPILQISPASLTFTQTIRDAAPHAQALTLTNSSGGGTFSAIASSNEQGWLSVMPASGKLPASVTVSADGSALAPGTHSGVITVISPDSSNSPQTIPVVLTVKAPPSISASSNALTWSYPGSGPALSLQTVSLTSTGTTAISFGVTRSPASSARWLSVTPTSGLTPATLAVNVNPDGLGPGRYTASVDIVPSESSTPISVTVTLTVASQPMSTITAVMNAATQQSGAVSPGEIITIYGRFSSVETAGLRLDASGNVETAVSNTRVLFDGIAAPLTYVSNTQINAVVPYEVASNALTHLQVEVGGLRSGSFEVPSAPAAPGIFTLDASGQGTGAVLNQDGTVSGISNPAAPGSIVSIYATGEGQTDPPGLTGSVIASDLKKPVLPVTVTMGGQPAQVVYAGSSPGLISGIMQVNAQVPDGIASSAAVPLVMTVGGINSQLNVTIAVQ